MYDGPPGHGCPTMTANIVLISLIPSIILCGAIYQMCPFWRVGRCRAVAGGSYCPHWHDLCVALDIPLRIAKFNYAPVVALTSPGHSLQARYPLISVLAGVEMYVGAS